MGVLDIDHDNLVVKKDIVKDRVVYTIDNFYKYPNAVIQLYHKFQQQIPMDDQSRFCGSRLDLRELFSEGVVDEHVKNLQTLLVTHGFDESKFVTPNEEEELFAKGENKSAVLLSKFVKQTGFDKPLKISGKGSMANPHADGTPQTTTTNKLAGVCYLSKDIHGGTAIYRNKEMDVYNVGPKFTEKIAHHICQKFELEGVKSSEEQANMIGEIYKDWFLKLYPRESSQGFMNETNEDFEMLHFFPMKFNRIVVYDSDLLHSMYVKDADFFDTHERLTANYFMQQIWEEVDSDVLKRHQRMLKVATKYNPKLNAILF